MCGSITSYREYDACTLKTSGNDGFIARIIGLDVSLGTPHQIIITSILRCTNVMNGPPKSTCSTIEDMGAEGVMKEPAYSEYDGPCPACVASENAVREACHQTKYVCPQSRDLNND